jgi:hypothetical protein
MHSNGVAALRGILKPMPDYGAHLRAGVEITKSGREYVVDDDAIKLISEKLKELGEDINRRLASPELQENEAERMRAKRHYDEAVSKLRSGVIDEPGKPLVLTSKGFEYMRQAFGVQLVNEPWDGQPRPLEAKPMSEREERAEIIAFLGRLDKRLTDIEAKVGNKPGKA